MFKTNIPAVNSPSIDNTRNVTLWRSRVRGLTTLVHQPSISQHSSHPLHLMIDSIFYDLFIHHFMKITWNCYICYHIVPWWLHAKSKFWANTQHLVRGLVTCSAIAKNWIAMNRFQWNPNKSTTFFFQDFKNLRNIILWIFIYNSTVFVKENEFENCEIWIKCHNFPLNKCIWKRRLRDVGNFVWVPMC